VLSHEERSGPHEKRSGHTDTAAQMARFPPPPCALADGLEHPLDGLMAGGAGAAPLARGFGRLLGVVERKEARARHSAC
jgi:hypothetical protein